MSDIRADHHPQCPARHQRVNLDRCNCRIPPIVDLTETVQACYRHAEALRVRLSNYACIGVRDLDLAAAADFLERLAATLDGSSTRGDEPRPWSQG